MESTSWSSRRIGGYAGIGFFVLLVALLISEGSSPTYDSTAAEIREYFVNNDTRIHLATVLGSMAFVFFLLPYAAGLRNVLASVEERGEEMWSRLSYTGAVLAVAVAAATTVTFETLSQGVVEDLPDETLVALARFEWVAWGTIIPWAFALMVGAASFAILRSGVLPKWIGWLGAVVVLLHVIGTLWVFTEDDESLLAGIQFAALMIGPIWNLAVAIVMIRGDGEPIVLVDQPERLTEDRSIETGAGA